MKTTSNFSRFFAIISEEKGESMIKDLEMFRKENKKMLREKLKAL